MTGSRAGAGGPARAGRMTRRVVVCTAGAGTAAAAWAAACGPQGKQVGPSSGRSDGDQRDLAPRQELRLNLGSEPNTIDPNLAHWLYELAVINSTWEGLLKFGTDMQLQPALATDVPSLSNGGISQDGLSYTF